MFSEMVDVETIKFQIISLIHQTNNLLEENKLNELCFDYHKLFLMNSIQDILGTIDSESSYSYSYKGLSIYSKSSSEMDESDSSYEDEKYKESFDVDMKTSEEKITNNNEMKEDEIPNKYIPNTIDSYSSYFCISDKSKELSRHSYGRLSESSDVTTALLRKSYGINSESSEYRDSYSSTLRDESKNEWYSEEDLKTRFTLLNFRNDDISMISDATSSNSDFEEKKLETDFISHHDLDYYTFLNYYQNIKMTKYPQLNYSNFYIYLDTCLELLMQLKNIEINKLSDLSKKKIEL
jgi:hypothetical protein